MGLHGCYGFGGGSLRIERDAAAEREAMARGTFEGLELLLIVSMLLMRGVGYWSMSTDNQGCAE